LVLLSLIRQANIKLNEVKKRTIKSTVIRNAMVKV
jgi:hypothetical protein